MSADPRYPIGKFRAPEFIGPAERAQYIEIIEACPGHFRKAVEGWHSGHHVAHVAELRKRMGW